MEKWLAFFGKCYAACGGQIKSAARRFLLARISGELIGFPHQLDHRFHMVRLRKEVEQSRRADFVVLEFGQVRA